MIRWGKGRAEHGKGAPRDSVERTVGQDRGRSVDHRRQANRPTVQVEKGGDETIVECNRSVVHLECADTD